MERVALLIEETGEQLRCMLNPEGLVLHRSTGLVLRRSLNGPISGIDMADDPLQYVGAGRLEFTLNLVFDVTLCPQGQEPASDVRELTSPLWRLAENSQAGQPCPRPPLVRFIWGKSWNIPVVVMAASERLENFTDEGSPLRSWLRLKLRRMANADRKLESVAPPKPTDLEVDRATVNPADLRHCQPIGDGGVSGERLDSIASKYYGHPAYWRLIARFNELDDPHAIGTSMLQIPPALGDLTETRS